MPIGLVLIGMLVLIAAVRGKHAEFGKLVAADFTGSQNFWQWILALGIAGAAGYYKPLESYSRLFMILLLLALLLAKQNRGFFEQFVSAFNNIQRGEPNVKPKGYNVDNGDKLFKDGGSIGPIPMGPSGLPMFAPGA